MVTNILAVCLALCFTLTSRLAAVAAVQAHVRHSDQNNVIMTSRARRATRQQRVLSPSAPQSQSSRNVPVNRVPVDRAVFRALAVPEAHRVKYNSSMVVKGHLPPEIHVETQSNRSSTPAAVEEVAIAETQSAEEAAAAAAAAARCSDFNTRLFSALKILALSTEHVRQRLRQFRLDEIGTVEMNLVSGTKFHRARDWLTTANATVMTSEDGGERAADVATLCTPTYRLRLSFDGYSLMDWTPAETQNLTAAMRTMVDENGCEFKKVEVAKIQSIASGRVVGTTEHQQGVFDNDVDGGEEEVANILNGLSFLVDFSAECAAPSHTYLGQRNDNQTIHTID